MLHYFAFAWTITHNFHNCKYLFNAILLSFFYYVSPLLLLFAIAITFGLRLLIRNKVYNVCFETKTATKRKKVNFMKIDFSSFQLLLRSIAIALKIIFSYKLSKALKSRKYSPFELAQSQLPNMHVKMICVRVDQSNLNLRLQWTFTFRFICVYLWNLFGKNCYYCVYIFFLRFRLFGTMSFHHQYLFKVTLGFFSLSRPFQSV